MPLSCLHSPQPLSPPPTGRRRRPRPAETVAAVTLFAPKADEFARKQTSERAPATDVRLRKAVRRRAQRKAEHSSGGVYSRYFAAEHPTRFHRGIARIQLGLEGSHVHLVLVSKAHERDSLRIRRSSRLLSSTAGNVVAVDRPRSVRVQRCTAIRARLRHESTPREPAGRKARRGEAGRRLGRAGH